MNSAPGRILAFDFGGTKLAAALVDRRSGEVDALVRRPTPAHLGAAVCLDEMIQAGRQALTLAGVSITQVEALGISFGGPVSPDRRSVVKSMHVQNWEFVDLPGRLEAVFQRPAFMDNDANLAALGEWAYGAGRGVEHMLYVQVSTGIGAGLIIDRQLYRGAGLAGEFGHLPLLRDDPAALECSCGRRGCLESLASGWALARDGRGIIAHR